MKRIEAETIKDMPEGVLASPHPLLQSKLPMLFSLNPYKGQDARLVFGSLEGVSGFLEDNDESERKPTGVWMIRHRDLGKSKIQGWTYTDKFS